MSKQKAADPELVNDPDDPYWIESTHKTPNGGIRSSIHFLDKLGKEAKRSVATNAIVHEYDANDEIVHSTHAELESVED